MITIEEDWITPERKVEQKNDKIGLACVNKNSVTLGLSKITFNPFSVKYKP